MKVRREHFCHYYPIVKPPSVPILEDPKEYRRKCREDNRRKILQEAIAFASDLGPDLVINIETVVRDGDFEYTVWYWDGEA